MVTTVQGKRVGKIHNSGLRGQKGIPTGPTRRNRREYTGSSWTRKLARKRYLQRLTK